MSRNANAKRKARHLQMVFGVPYLQALSFSRAHEAEVRAIRKQTKEAPELILERLARKKGLARKEGLARRTSEK